MIVLVYNLSMLYFFCFEYVHIMKNVYWYMYNCKTNKVNVKNDVVLMMKNNPDFFFILDFGIFGEKS